MIPPTRTASLPTPDRTTHTCLCPPFASQTIITDCSFVSSLVIAAAYERKFRKQLITKIIFPQDRSGVPLPLGGYAPPSGCLCPSSHLQDRSGVPLFNPAGKYLVKVLLPLPSLQALLLLCSSPQALMPPPPPPPPVTPPCGAAAQVQRRTPQDRRRRPAARRARRPADVLPLDAQGGAVGLDHREGIHEGRHASVRVATVLAGRCHA